MAQVQIAVRADRTRSGVGPYRWIENSVEYGTGRHDWVGGDAIYR